MSYYSHELDPALTEPECRRCGGMGGWWESDRCWIVCDCDETRCATCGDLAPEPAPAHEARCPSCAMQALTDA